MKRRLTWEKLLDLLWPSPWRYNCMALSAGKEPIMAMTSTKKKEIQQTWNRITGTMKVYGNTFDVKGKKGETITKWSVSISGKASKDSEEYKNYYLPVYFRGKDAEEPDEDGLHTIEVSNAFLSLDIYTNKNNEEVQTLVLIVTDDEVTE